MSLPSDADAFSDSTAATWNEPYWCNQCHMCSFIPPPSSLPSSSTTDALPRCPYCLFTNISPIPISVRSPEHNSNPNPDSTSSYLNSPSGNLSPIPFVFLNDNLWYEGTSIDPQSRYLLLASSYNFPNRPNPPLSTPASKTAIDALAIVKISNEILKNDCLAMCAICKDEFVVNEEVKMLPCKHFYHSNCILPWLENNHTCPICRFKLSIQVDEEIFDELGMGIDETYVGANDDVDLFGFSRVERQIEGSNNHHVLEDQNRQLEEEQQSLTSDGTLSTWDNVNNMTSQNEDFFISSTQIGDDGPEFGITGRANSTETVSSWPASAQESIADSESTSINREEGYALRYSRAL